MQINILKFWRDVEIFTIPIPPTVKDQREPTIIVREEFQNGILPWENSKSLTAESEKITYSHTVFLGIAPLRILAGGIQAVVSLPDSEEGVGEVERMSGTGCMATFKVNEAGVPENNSFLPASFVYGVERLRNGLTLDGLTEDMGSARDEFNRRRLVYNEVTAAPIPLTWEHLREEHALLQARLGVDIPAHITIRTLRICIRPPSNGQDVNADDDERKKSDDPVDFLNSFFLNDLDTLIEQQQGGAPFGSALAMYLAETTPHERTDILRSRKALQHCLNPHCFALGRWPSASHHHLMLAQQAAVNKILAELDHSCRKNTFGGMVTVNGPPGTGKSTLLREIMAHVVVRRAERLAAFTNFYGLFESTRGKLGSLEFHPLLPELVTDSSMVVCSSNNSAVENITKELPLELFAEEHPNAGYFAPVARALSPKTSPWGLVSAALGNKSNRIEFANRLFWGLPEKETKKYGSPANGIKICGMNALLGEYKNLGDADKTNRWRTAQKKFLTLLSEVRKTRTACTAAHACLNASEKLRSAEEAVNVCEDAVRAAGRNASLKEKEMQLLNSESISFFDRLLAFFSFHTAAFADRQRRLRAALQASHDAEKVLQQHEEALCHAKTALSALKKRFEGLTSQAAEVSSDMLRPDAELLNPAEKNRHLQSVWADSESDLARSRLFMAALELHQCAIYLNAEKFSKNFRALCKMLKGEVNPSAAIRRQLWDILFFAVPVVSTTLASFDRLFVGMDQESLGWVFMDEAGQATPQSAVGALWRARRAVLVGDPLQIEPVLTIPEAVERHLRKKHNVPDVFSPLNQSAQTLGDRMMSTGAWIGDTGKADDVCTGNSGQGKPDNAQECFGAASLGTWTGMPLRAHRRCVDPMFSVANAIAYDNQMVQATPAEATPHSPTGAKVECVLGPSVWLDVAGRTGTTQVVAEELDCLGHCLKNCEASWPRVNDKDARVYVISPFKRIAVECGQLVNNVLSEKHQKMCKTGTVHTFQGQEAPVVFIVLGSASGSAGSASRAWAAQRPNLLNVALTRSKFRVYVIGNRADWSVCAGFDQLAGILPVINSSSIIGKY